MCVSERIKNKNLLTGTTPGQHPTTDPPGVIQVWWQRADPAAAAATAGAHPRPDADHPTGPDAWTRIGLWIQGSRIQGSAEARLCNLRIRRIILRRILEGKPARQQQLRSHQQQKPER